MPLPWNDPPLDEWAIIGMNHYFIYPDGHTKNQKFLFVAMGKDGQLIKAEGPCEELVFISLKQQAKEIIKGNKK